MGYTVIMYARTVALKSPDSFQGGWDGDEYHVVRTDCDTPTSARSSWKRWSCAISSKNKSEPSNEVRSVLATRKTGRLEISSFTRVPECRFRASHN